MQFASARSSPTLPVRAARPCLHWRTNKTGLTHTPAKFIPRRDVKTDVTALEGFTGFSSLMRPELAAIFSAVIAVGSVGLNLYGGLLTESKRVDLQRQVEREKSYREQQQELQSIIARYRGPLLEASVDLEQRIHHLITMTGEWWLSSDQLCYEEITYTMYTIAQFLGFIEVVRREGPRERSFLQAGSAQGTDTLATLQEAFRFVLCASPASLESWYSEQADGVLDHPGARHRVLRVPGRHSRPSAMSRPELVDGTELPLRISRGMQRAIGSLMIVTPAGASRHYTLSYSTFYQKLHADQAFAQWFAQLEQDLVLLLTGPAWAGEPPLPINRWTRVILLQQLMVDCIDLLDPDNVRVPDARRVRLSPVKYSPLPGVAEYQATLSALSAALDPFHTHSMAGLQNLSRPAPAPAGLLGLPGVQLPGLPIPGMAQQNGGGDSGSGEASGTGSPNGSGSDTEEEVYENGYAISSNGSRNGNGNGSNGSDAKGSSLGQRSYSEAKEAVKAGRE